MERAGPDGRPATTGRLGRRRSRAATGKRGRRSSRRQPEVQRRRRRNSSVTAWAGWNLDLEAVASDEGPGTPGREEAVAGGEVPVAAGWEEAAAGGENLPGGGGNLGDLEAVAGGEKPKAAGLKEATAGNENPWAASHRGLELDEVDGVEGDDLEGNRSSDRSEKIQVETLNQARYHVKVGKKATYVLSKAKTAGIYTVQKNAKRQ